MVDKRDAMIDRLKERMTLQLEAVCDCADLLTLIPHLWCTLIGEAYWTRGSLTLIKGTPRARPGAWWQTPGPLQSYSG